MEQALPDQERDTGRGHNTLKRRLGEVGVVLAGAIAGFSLANANGFESELGPITTNTSISVGENTVRYGADMIRFDSPYPVGARIEIDGFAADDVASLKDMAPYLQDAGAAQSIIAKDIARQGSGWALAGAGTTALLMGLRRNDSRRKITIAGSAAATILGTGVPALTNGQDRNWQQISYYGQVIPSVEVSGPTSREAMKFLGKNEAYYTGIDKAVSEALEPVIIEDESRGDTAMLFVTDHHCNMGQYRVVATIADRLHIDTLLNGGDETMGTPIDPLCFNIRSERLNGIENRLNILGNHDNADVRDLYKRAGDTVLEGQVVTVNNLSITGFADPTITPFGSETHLRSNETREEFQHRIVDTTKRTNPDIVLVHDPTDAKFITPYADLVLSGHLHKSSGPTPSDNGNWQYTGGTSGGQTPGNITQVQKLGTDASVMVIYSRDGQLTGTREITVKPDTSIDVGELVPINLAQTFDNYAGLQK